MKVSAMLLGSLVIFGAAASAQEKAPTPAAELGFSYSYTRVNPGGAISSTNANGGYGYAEYNFNRVFGLVAELGANHTGAAGNTLLGTQRSSICLDRGSTGGSHDSRRTYRLYSAARDSPTVSTPILQLPAC